VSGLGALRRGLRAARAGWRAVVVCWAADLAVAAAAAVAFVLAWDGLAAARPDAGALAARFDERLFGDLVARHQALFGAADVRVLVVTAAGVLLHAVLAGGLLDVLGRAGADQPAPARVRAFLAACAAHAGRMLAIALVAAGLLGLSGWLLHGILADALEDPIRFVAREQNRLILKLLPGVAFLVVLGAVGLTADVWRACAVVTDRPLGGALRLALRLVRRRPGAFVTVGAGGLALQAAAVAGFTALDGAIPQGRWAGILAVIALGQALMLWRHGVRAAVLAAAARLCRDETAAALPEPAAEPAAEVSAAG
jgi:hypothetical protein